MEPASPLPLQNCTTTTSTPGNIITNHHNQNIVPNKQYHNSPSILAGNEENAPENNILQQQRAVILKKMRVGGSSFPQQQNCRLSSNNIHFDNNNDDDGVPPPPHSFRVTQDGKNVDAGGFLVSSSNVDILQVVPSASDSNSATTDTSSIHHNWLDDFGKQQNASSNNGSSSSKPTMTMRAPEKDPRFHCKRKTQPQSDAKHVSENAHPSLSAAPLFTNTEVSPVFLAPVILRHSPTARMEQQVESPWKESTNGFASPPPPSMTRRSKEEPQTNSSHSKKPLSFAEAFRPDAMEPSSVVAWDSQDDIVAATQEAPELTTSLSQETATSSTAMSALTASSTASSMASTLVKRMVADKPLSIAQKDAAKARLHRQGIRGTPIRMKPRVRTQEVQATDSGYASVAKLSAWLADDPTSTKKVKHVRRGRNVISKSRKFEKDLEDVIVEENNIATGAVKEKKNWLKSAFAHEEDCGGDDSSRHMDDSFSSHDHHGDHRHMMMMMRTQPVNLDDGCARSEFVVSNDAASSISVSHKKKWLQSAFKKEGDASGQRRLSYARSDIGPAREHRDDVTSRAKQMWQQKSEKRLGDGPPSATKFHAAPSPYRKQRPPAARDSTPGKSLEERMRARMGTTRASAPSHMLAKAAHAATTSASTKPPTRHSVAVVQVEEDKTPVDFRAARELLIQRSKQNGNEVKLVSKVQTRANKFEKISKDTKRRSSCTGLLKPTWDSNSSVTGSVASNAPSNAYTKSFVEDVAPQKSFDELP